MNPTPFVWSLPRWNPFFWCVFTKMKSTPFLWSPRRWNLLLSFSLQHNEIRFGMFPNKWHWQGHGVYQILKLSSVVLTKERYLVFFFDSTFWRFSSRKPSKQLIKRAPVPAHSRLSLLVIFLNDWLSLWISFCLISLWWCTENLPISSPISIDCLLTASNNEMIDKMTRKQRLQLSN